MAAVETITKMTICSLLRETFVGLTWEPLYVDFLIMIILCYWDSKSIDNNLPRMIIDGIESFVLDRRYGETLSIYSRFFGMTI